jgi:hypothetical protein
MSCFLNAHTKYVHAAQSQAMHIRMAYPHVIHAYVMHAPFVHTHAVRSTFSVGRINSDMLSVTSVL